MQSAKTYINQNSRDNFDIQLSVIVTFFDHQNIINKVLTGITDSIKLISISP